MADINPNTIANSARCYDQCIPTGMQRAVMIYLLTIGMTGNVTPDSLMDGAKCYDKCIPDGMKDAVIIYLLTVIGGGGGGGGGLCGNTFLIRDAPSSPEPPPPNIDCVYWLDFRDKSPTLKWDNVGHFWF